MAELDLEVFKGRGQIRSKAASVTIMRRGTFSMNQAAYEMIGEPNSVEFLYDKKQKIVGIRAASADDKYTYPARPVKGRSPYLVAGTAFCEHYGIPIDITRRYDAKPYGDSKTLLIDLKEEGVRIGPGAKNKEQEL